MLRDQRERGVVEVRGGRVCPWQGWSAMAKPTGPTRKNLEGAWPRVGRSGCPDLKAGERVRLWGQAD